MPQLDIVYTFAVYLWTWMTLNLIMMTIKSTTIVKPPKPKYSSHKKTMPNLPWT